MASEASQKKKIIIKWKQSLYPLSSNQAYIQDPTSDKSKRGGGSGPSDRPLWIRACGVNAPANQRGLIYGLKSASIVTDAYAPFSLLRI